MAYKLLAGRLMSSEKPVQAGNPAQAVITQMGFFQHIDF
jgi:hypothetical protein